MTRLLKECRVILVSNIKGGVAKTTSAVNVASILSALGFKVLLIDTDPQGNATNTSRIENPNKSIYSVIKFGVSPRECIYNTPFGYDIIPCIQPFKDAIPYLVEDNKTFKTVFEPLRDDYDFIIIDTIPTEAKVVLNNMFFADFLIAPIKFTKYSVDGLASLFSDFNAVKEEGAGIEFLGILGVEYDQRILSNKIYLDEVQKEFKNLVFETIIVKKTSVVTCEALQMPLLYFDKSDAATKNYINLTLEIVERLGLDSFSFRRIFNAKAKVRGSFKCPQ